MEHVFQPNGDRQVDDNEMASIEFIEPSIKVYDFQEAITENVTIKYQVLKMNNSILVWIGANNNPKFSDLSLAMKSPYDKLPLTSRIVGHSMDAPSLNLASRLTRKLDKPVYVSINFPTDRLTLPDIEKRLLLEIQENPGAF